MTTPLENYLAGLRDIRSSGAGVDETSYYGQLENLFNEIGKTLKPRVKCILQLKNRGAGNPDGGLFTEDQYRKRPVDEPLLGQVPARGVIEIKPTKDDAWVTAQADQVTRYWQKYRLVLITNYRDFVLIGKDELGKALVLESYRLARNEKEFWLAAAHPKKMAQQHASRFVEYLKRVMLHAAELDEPKVVAEFLASYAREALARIEGQPGASMQMVRTALEEALGLKFEGERGEHFFRSSLVQTLFYGVFSAWVLWDKQHLRSDRKARFAWNDTARLLRVPIIRKLFHEVAEPGQLEEMHLTEVLEWATTVLNRVDRAAFFQRFEEGHAVQYFYEPFLEAFDPELRKQLGVWYTPPEIVEYMVARVDTVLREELGVADGLADKQVYVLDPCCGTGSYLVEVLKLIHATLEKKGKDALTAGDLREAAQKRVFGFEILPAPFVVSHLQLGLLLQHLGAPLGTKKEDRVGVYLTNALTGWEPPKGPKQHLIFPELEEERDAAEKVKRDTPILVILGNPPYNAFTGVGPTEEQGLVEPYKVGLVSEWKIKKFNLDDLYVRFVRLAERRIGEKSDRGVICFISNFSYLGDPSFLVMRRRLLQEFDTLWFDCLNGDSRETGKRTPDGKPDPSVFSTEYNREGIRVGTTIGLFVRRNGTTKRPRTKFRHLWGVSKRTDLLESLQARNFESMYEESVPENFNRYSFRPEKVRREYKKWPSLHSLAAFPPTLGILENRQEELISIDRASLKERMLRYFDSELDWEELKKLGGPLTKDFARFVAKKTREKVLAAESFSEKSLRPLMIRPMDVRWCYYSGVRPLWNEPRPSYVEQLWTGNVTLVSRRKGVASPEGVPFFFTACLGFQHSLHTDAYYIPLRIRQTRIKKAAHAAQWNLIPTDDGSAANLSASTRAYLKKLAISDLDHDERNAGQVWIHALAIGYSPAYLRENADGIRQDWPRMPLPASKELLEKSAELGRQVAGLLDTEAPVKGVTEGEIREELKLIGVATRAGEGAGKMPALQEEDLAVKAGWGHGGKGGVTMPGRGKLVEREYRAAERKAIAEGAKALGLSEKEALAHLGERTCDVFLNDVAYLANVPQKVWEYTIGGYQVMKKWLSYREEKLLGRALKPDEVRYVQEMARRIAAILLLEPALDANYQAAKANTFPWDSLK